ncbi:MAG: hypothetical protein ACPGVD_10025 [Flavobacteriales bacterium]
MNQNTFYFSPDELVSELKREQKMRRKVWKRRSGGEAKFVSKTHQKQYDKMEEVILLLETLGALRVEKLQLMVIEILTAQQKLEFPKEE